MLPNPLEEIARTLDDYNKRLSSLERLETTVGIQTEFIPASAFNIGFGGPSVGVLDIATTPIGFSTWLLSPSTEEIVNSSWRIPTGLTSGLNYAFYWAMESAIAGNIRLRIDLAFIASGEVSTGGSSESNFSTIAVPGVAQTITRTLASVSSVFDPLDAVAILFDRVGNDGADTASGDMHFIGFEWLW